MSEPKAWFYEDDEFKSVSLYRDALQGEALPLYSHPQKELTDEEIINTLDKICYEGDSGCVTNSVTIFHQTIVNFARAVLKKASEK
jgi:hypothetical protein